MSGTTFEPCITSANRTVIDVHYITICLHQYRLEQWQRQLKGHIVITF